MAKRTKKVGSAGRFGARYGVRIRRRIGEVEAKSKGRHECPKCRAIALQRIASGIWVCRHCDARLASSSYMPTPPAAVRREVAAVLAEAKAKEEGAVVETEELPKAEKPKKGHHKE